MFSSVCSADGTDGDRPQPSEGSGSVGQEEILPTPHLFAISPDQFTAPITPVPICVGTSYRKVMTWIEPATEEEKKAHETLDAVSYEKWIREEREKDLAADLIITGISVLFGALNPAQALRERTSLNVGHFPLFADTFYT